MEKGPNVTGDCICISKVTKFKANNNNPCHVDNLKKTVFA